MSSFLSSVDFLPIFYIHVILVLNVILQIFVFYFQLCTVYLSWRQKEKGVAEDETVITDSMYLWYIIIDRIIL